MPRVRANGIELNYERQGAGEPLVLIPYLAADNASWAFQLPAYAEAFDCVAIDPRGVGESDKPVGPYAFEVMADDVAGLMDALDIERAHVAGVSFGASMGTWLAAKHSDRVASLSLHSAWDRSDPFLRSVVDSWRALARGLGDAAEMVIAGIFPWCFTPDAYAREGWVEGLADF